MKKAGDEALSLEGLIVSEWDAAPPLFVETAGLQRQEEVTIFIVQVL